MAKSTKKQNIFSLKDISIDNVVEKHIALLEERAKPQRVITNFQDVTCDNSWPNMKPFREKVKPFQEN